VRAFSRLLNHAAFRVERRLTLSIARKVPAQHQTRAEQRLRRLMRPAALGTLRRTSPLSERWGLDRGKPVDRYYIEDFLREHRADIRGHVLELKDSSYACMFGTGVTEVDVLDIDSSNRNATIVADLAAAQSIPSATFDCFILTQTLQMIPDTRAAIRHAHRILRRDGVLLATVPSVSRLISVDGDYWRFTAAACKYLFGEFFPRDGLVVRPYGNVLSSIAFLTGMASEELKTRELDDFDSRFPLVVGVRAVKSNR
jgi:SAM-dependent methyltransferase